jgi:hypothetical protein
VANLTLTIDESVLRRARIRALEDRTSVNALVRTYLEAYAAGSGQEAARGRLLDLSDQVDAGSGTAGRRWRREDIYDGRARSAT